MRVAVLTLYVPQRTKDQCGRIIERVSIYNAAPASPAPHRSENEKEKEKIIDPS